jgi:hypothetical protein
MESRSDPALKLSICHRSQRQSAMMQTTSETYTRPLKRRKISTKAVPEGQGNCAEVMFFSRDFDGSKQPVGAFRGQSIMG